MIHGTLEDSSLSRGAFDAVFIWNCFEQLPDPEDTLKTVRRMLKPSGLLVIRVPNLSFYRALRHSRDLGRKALAYNNLLGFPYLYGYSMRTLDWLMQRMGFEHVRGLTRSCLRRRLPILLRK